MISIIGGIPWIASLVTLPGSDSLWQKAAFCFLLACICQGLNVSVYVTGASLGLKHVRTGAGG